MEAESQQENTYVLDTESPVEMARLIDQDRFTTKAMGGAFAGIPTLPQGARVLDLACGPGSWVLDIAFERPDIEVAGVDISKIMIDYANARARTQKLTNASFGVMDITQPLDLSDHSFDLVNARSLTAVLRREAWQPFLNECTRVLKSGGLLRLTEPVEPAGISSSPAYDRLGRLTTMALWRAGYGFSSDGHSLGLTNSLPRMLRKMGYHDVHCLLHALEFSADCEAWQDFYRNVQAGSGMILQFFVQMGVATQEELEQLYQQVYPEMLSSDFCAMSHFMTILGTKP